MDDAPQRHFDGISSKYEAAAATWSAIYSGMAKVLDPLLKGKDVLEIGNGGMFGYDVRGARSVTVIDVSPAMLELVREPGVRKLVGDARHLDGVPDASADALVLVLVLHHINGPDRRSALQTLDAILASARRVLRPGGLLVVTEGVLAPPLFALQGLLYRLTRAVLAVSGVPMIYFYSLNVLRQRIATLFRDPQCHPLPLQGGVDVLGASFPGLLVLPAPLHPLRFKMLVATRP